MKTGVYQIRNLVNGKCYIGSAAGKNGFDGRWRVHLHHLHYSTHANSYLQNAWNKHGEEFFVFEILKVYKPDQCLAYEQYYLDVQKPEYNINPNANSRLGVKLSDETKAKIAQKAKGNQRWLGKKHSEVTKQKMRKPKHSRESKAKLRESHLGLRHSQETKNKMSQQRRGEKHHGAKLTEKDVRQIKQLLSEGISGVQIAKQFHIKPITISNIKTGRRWMHVTGGV